MFSLSLRLRLMLLMAFMSALTAVLMASSSQMHDVFDFLALHSS